MIGLKLDGQPLLIMEALLVLHVMAMSLLVHIILMESFGLAMSMTSVTELS
jgi:hypothetical protein